jgi:hypothetical protein
MKAHKASPSSSTDPKHTFRPRARILHTLGDELISSETVAILELVKNSYDADATRVLVRFGEPLEKGKGSVEIIDDGTGMSLETLQSIWLEPATPSKIERTVTPGRRRRVLGAKGIGRFASAKLADRLEVVTRQDGEPFESFANFAWGDFDDASLFLDQITIPSGTREPVDICAGGAIEWLWTSDDAPARGRKTHGTILRMTGLKQTWAERQLMDLRRALSRLISPFTRVDEFKILLQTSGDAETIEKIEAPELVKHSHYSVRGTVNEAGRFDLVFRVEASGKKAHRQGKFVRGTESLFRLISTEVNRTVENTRPLHCGPITLDFRVWDRDELGNVVQATGSTLKDVRADLDAIAGISVYRDGFRVLPYGEPKNDWLRLDMRRVQNPTTRLSNNQIYGYVAITADENPQLKDQSNREGLVDGPALQDLQDVVIEILSVLESQRYEARPRRKQTTPHQARALFGSVSLAAIRDSLGPQANIPTVRKALESTDRLLQDSLRNVQEVLARYHRLATVGQLIDVVLHDGRQPVASIVNQASLGLESVARSPVITKAEPKLGSRFVVIKSQAENLGTLFRRIEPFGGRKRGRPKQVLLEGLIQDTFALFETQLDRLKVKKKLPATETLVRVDSTEFQEIIINLLQNSLYWLESVPEKSREIIVAVKRRPDTAVEVIFSDSGPGVDAEHRESIFEPYFSTKPEGVGLGLTIAGEIASDYYEGSLELMDSGPLPGATFRLTLRKRV